MRADFALGYHCFDATAGIDRVTNFAHTTGDNRTPPFLQINLSTFVFSLVKVN